MDWLAKCFTGVNTNLLKTYEDKLKSNHTQELQPKQRTLEDENKMLSDFESMGIKINEQK
jgi:hypothetical protein